VHHSDLDSQRFACLLCSCSSLLQRPSSPTVASSGIATTVGLCFLRDFDGIADVIEVAMGAKPISHS